MNETELLFTDILGCERLGLYLERERLLSKDESMRASFALKRRIGREPIQYILGKTEFMGLEFRINKDVFIPRPESELLVEKALEAAKKIKKTPLRVLDIGTGSGCIAISMAKFMPAAEITAIDISREAIRTARESALLNKVRINFLQSDLFTNYEFAFTNYDMIISNPPYIASAEIERLEPEVQCEPRLALDGGGDGLDFYRRISEEAGPYLSPQGLLILEMGFGQKQGVKNIFQKGGLFEIIEVIQDYNRIDRVAVIQKKRGNG